VVFEHFSAASPADATVIVEEEGNLQYVFLQDLAPGEEVRARRDIRLKRGATATVVVASVGGGMVEQEIRGLLEGADAVCNISVMAYARASEKQKISVRNVFGAARGGGEIIMRAVAEDTAHVRCDGLIEIGLQGGGTDTYLTQEVLMLDPSAKVDAIPGLEIKTNDVKASHSATVSRVTEEDLFYFASRGILEREARKMFVEGFLADIAERIPDAAVREQIAAAVEAKYARGEA
jgi:Fe-S cluster assembly scaffold protein SufB